MSDQGVTDNNVDPQQTNARPPEGGGGSDNSNQPNPVEERLARLEKELAERDKRIQELATSERYWAEQARQALDLGSGDEGADDEPDDEARR